MDSDQLPPHTRRIGLLGGTFDPIHYAHLVVAEEVRASLHLDTVVFIPVGQPPHKPERASTAPEHRLAMLRLAIASNPYFIYSRVEIDRPGPSYLADTLRLLRAQWGQQVELDFVLGWDSLIELPNWHHPQDIVAALSKLVAVGRPGHVEKLDTTKQELEAHLPGITQRLLVIPVPQLDISSTDLRHRVSEGKPIKYQVPEAVEQYIGNHGLYRL
ncbi:MAG TPA: nicotinate-nucleotide adenylyltransferase [Ktedonobacteraceae bacterium]